MLFKFSTYIFNKFKGSGHFFVLGQSLPCPNPGKDNIGLKKLMTGKPRTNIGLKKLMTGKPRTNIGLKKLMKKKAQNRLRKKKIHFQFQKVNFFL